MKKLIYGLGAIAATVTPVVAVVSCGKNSKNEFAKANIEFVAKNTVPNETLKGWWGLNPIAQDFDRTNIIYAKDSDALKAVLTAASAKTVLDKPLTDALNKIEEKLRMALSVNTGAEYADLVAVEKEQLANPNQGNVLSIGTYVTKGSTGDDHIEISLNGTSKDLVIKFLSSVKLIGLNETEAKIWESLKQAI